MNIAQVRRTVAELAPQARALHAREGIVTRAQAAQQTARQQIAPMARVAA